MVWVGEWDSEVLCVRVRAGSPALAPWVDPVKYPERVRRAAVHWKMLLPLFFFFFFQGRDAFLTPIVSESLQIF